MSKTALGCSLTRLRRRRACMAATACRAAALGQAQPERARCRGDRRRRSRGRRGRPDAGQHAAGPGARSRVRPAGARRRRRWPLGRRRPSCRGAGGLGVPGRVSRCCPSSAWVGSPPDAMRSNCSRPAPTPFRSARPPSVTRGHRGRCATSLPAGARPMARPSATCGRRRGSGRSRAHRALPGRSSRHRLPAMSVPSPYEGGRRWLTASEIALRRRCAPPARCAPASIRRAHCCGRGA